jgi:RNA 2',3'-cyclic 3'-phosphodiesterase
LLQVEQAGHAPERENWRVFCAIDLPAVARKRVVTHIEGLRRSLPHAHASWNRHENLHLTLKFLGEIKTSRLTSLSTATASAVADLRSFQVTIEETGVFPKHGPPRVLWIGVKDELGRLADLQARLEDECAKQGFTRDERAFHPHLTLARLRKPQGARELALAHKELHFKPIEVTVSELLVIRSELSSTGSKYTVISRHPLDGRRQEQEADGRRKHFPFLI